MQYKLCNLSSTTHNRPRNVNILVERTRAKPAMTFDMQMVISLMEMVMSVMKMEVEVVMVMVVEMVLHISTS